MESVLFEGVAKVRCFERAPLGDRARNSSPRTAASLCGLRWSSARRNCSRTWVARRCGYPASVRSRVPRRGTMRGMSMVCSTRESTSSQSRGLLLIRRRRPMVHTSSSSMTMSAFCHLVTTSSHIRRASTIPRSLLVATCSSVSPSGTSTIRLCRMALKIMEYVMAFAPARPVSDILAATPQSASISIALAHTFNMTLVCMIDGVTREFGANIE